MKVFALTVVLLFVGCAFGDLYMQNPRGSNDRLNEANTNRNNANRLFDSQNNAKGGYCWGPAMSFYEGSQLTIEWTAQHGCGNSKLYCNMVIQYMCTKNDADPMIRIRDGTTTNTIPDTPDGPTATDANGDLLYGMHESYDSYQACKKRQRNMGLWISDRESEGGLTAGRSSSIYTRQNNNGDRHGYECPEERDYYPYWAPSEWKDIAILTHDKSWCSYYQKHSQNVDSRGKCVDANDDKTLLSPNAAGGCQTKGGKWEKVNSKGKGSPECIQAPWSRDNHLGNGRTGYANSYNWTIPDDEDCIKDNKCACVLRLRYNISTTDLNGAAQGNVNGNSPTNFIDWRSNAAASPIYDDEIVNGSGMVVQLAMDTTQFGRTFQDRSHVFQIRPRKGSNVPPNVRVFNLNVRGKRGNIVETYPATEYDFVPEVLYVRLGDYIHFQWTGCDTNPAGNAGEGTDQTDRSNIVQIENLGANEPASDKWLSKHLTLFDSAATRKRMAFVDQNPDDCQDYATLLKNNNNNEDQAKRDVHNCMKLNAGSQYFDGGALRMNHTTNERVGFYYMSTRNNNFSNRGQKGVIFVLNVLPDWAIGLVSAGAGLFVASAGIAGGIFYAKSHPHSKIAEIFNRF